VNFPLLVGFLSIYISVLAMLTSLQLFYSNALGSLVSLALVLGFIIMGYSRFSRYPILFVLLWGLTGKSFAICTEAKGVLTWFGFYESGYSQIDRDKVARLGFGEFRNSVVAFLGGWNNNDLSIGKHVPQTNSAVR
jgi:hypothetical protein